MIDNYYHTMAPHLWFIIPLMITVIVFCATAEHFEDKWK